MRTTLIIFSLFFHLQGHAQVVISDATPGNVNRSGFDLIWRVSGETIPELDIFSDAAGTVSVRDQVAVTLYPLAEGDVTPESSYEARLRRYSLQQYMAGKGLVWLRLQNCTPGTTYYVRPVSVDETGAANGNLLPLLPVKTATDIRFLVESRQLVLDFPTGQTEGALVQLSHASSAYPLFAAVGDEGEGRARFDLSQLLDQTGDTHAQFSGETHFSVELYNAQGGIISDYSVNYDDSFRVALASFAPFNLNNQPVLENPIPNQVAVINEPFSFTLAANTFSDPDDETLTLSASLSGGQALPSWLLFDGETASFSGTPGETEVEPLSLIVTATDPTGGSASADFQLSFVQLFRGELAFTQAYVIIDEDIGTLQLEVLRSNGMDGTVSVDFATLDGTATADQDYGPSSGTLTWQDGEGGARTISIPILPDAVAASGETFAVNLSNPTGRAILGAISSLEVLIQPLFQLELLSEPTEGGTLSGAGTFLTGTQAPIGADTASGYRFDGWQGDGVADPQALQTTVNMDADKQVRAVFVKQWQLTVEANPSEGGSVSGSGTFDEGSLAPISATPVAGYFFNGWSGDNIQEPNLPDTHVQVTADLVLVANFTSNAPPVVVIPLPDQTALLDEAFLFALDPGSFSDPELGPLTLSATTVAGNILPAWLSFDGSSFSGTPTSGDEGSLHIRVTATDNQGATVFDDFDLEVSTPAVAEIHGQVFHDLNGNASRDAGETGLADWSVFLDINRNGSQDSGEPAQITDSNGGYAFTAVAPGSYVLDQVLPEGWQQSLGSTLFSTPDHQPAATFNQLAVGDLDLDGYPDLVMLETAANAAHLYLNHDGRFIENGMVSLPNDPAALVLADLNGDSYLDLVSANSGSASISVLLNTGSGSFASPVNISVGNTPVALLALDLNNDGIQDLVTANQDSGDLSLFTGNGDGSFVSAPSLTLNQAPGPLFAADLDQDGDQDLLVLHPVTGNLSLLLNQSTGFDIVGINANISSLTLSDIDGDGLLDLVAAHSTEQLLSMWRNNGGGFFQRVSTLELETSPLAISSADVDLDGDADTLVVLANNSLLLLENRGRTHFSEPIVFETNLQPDQIASADIDGDRDLDLITLADGFSLFTNQHLRLLTLEDGDALTGVDFANRQQPADITGLVFRDLDANGIKDANDPPLPGWTLYLDLNSNGQWDTDEPYTFSEADGTFGFFSLPPGSYELSQLVPEGWLQSQPQIPSYTTVLVAGQLAGDFSFGNSLDTILQANTTSDSIDALPGDGLAQDANGNSSLRALIMEANALPGADEIQLGEGVFILELPGILEEQAYSGDLDITDHLTLSGAGVGLTVIDAASLDRIFDISPGINVQLRDLSLRNGDADSADGGNGGAIRNQGNSLLSTVFLHANRATAMGGALWSSGQLTLEGCTLAENTAMDGGAIANQGQLLMVNSTLSGNEAATSGGGLFNTDSAQLSFVTVAGNLSNQGGGIANSGGTVQLENTLVARNNASQDPDTNGSFNSSGHNLIGAVGNASGLVNGSNGDLVGTVGAELDPELTVLDFYDGPTPVHLLFTTSPAIDSGLLSDGVLIDQQGSPRPLDGNGDGTLAADIGAVEAIGPSLTVLSPSGGETWLVGQQVEITWIGEGFAGGVSIQVSRDGGANWEFLFLDTENDGSADWKIHAPGGNSVIVRVTSISLPSVFDENDSPFIIPQPAIEVLSPNGGELLTVGQQIEVTWLSENFVGNVGIEVSRDGGTSWGVAEGFAENTGSFFWTVTGPGSEDTLLRVLARNDISIFDQSDAPFTIPQPELELLSPNGGEIWLRDEYYPITWTSHNLSGNLRIDLSRDGGTSWENLVYNTEDDGEFSWKARGPSTDQALIRIYAIGDTSVAAQSEAVFQLPQPEFTMLSPNGGESYLPGQVVSLTWTSLNHSGEARLELSRDAGLNWEPINWSTDDDGNEEWVVTGPATNLALIRVSSPADPSIFDLSDGPFAIADTQLQIMSPNGGETLVAGELVPITWNGTGLSGNVHLDISRDGGLSWQTLVWNTANDGQEDWLVKGAATDQGLVRIRSANNATIYDESDDFFTIPPASLSLFTPTSGQTALLGSLLEITWTSTNFNGNVILELSRNGGASWITLQWNGPNDGHENWTVSGSATNQARIRLRAKDDPTLFSISDNFTIPQASINLTTPNGGETLILTSTTTITWSSVNLAGFVRIQVSRDGGITWNGYVVYQTENDGSYNWVVTAPATKNARFRVFSAHDESVSDQSDNNCIITN